jgi:hypothetical protein
MIALKMTQKGLVVDLVDIVVETLRRMYGLHVCGRYAWDGTPDVVKEEFETGREVDMLVAHDGITVRLCGEDMLVEVDVYADSNVPVLAGILTEPADVVAESPTADLCPTARPLEDELRRRGVAVHVWCVADHNVGSAHLNKYEAAI